MAESVSSDVGPSLLSRAVRRHSILVLLTTLLFAGVVGVFALTRSPTYTSATTVLLKPLPGTPLSPNVMGTAQQITGMNAEASLVNSTAVVARVNEVLGSRLKVGSRSVKATVPPNNTVITIDFTADTAGEARNGANAFANAAISYRAEQSASDQKRHLVALQKRIRSVEAQLATASPKQGLVKELTELRAAVTQLSAGGTNPGEIITPAQKPTSQSDLNPWLLIAAAGVVGMAAGLALALWRERSANWL